MNISGVAFFAYVVKDLPTVSKYYRDNLGLKDGMEPTDVYVEFDVDGTAFGLYAGTEPENPSGIIAFTVPSVEEAVAELKSKGIEPLGIEDLPTCKMAFYKDPEGNDYMLHQLL